VPHGAYPLMAAARDALLVWTGFVLRALMPLVLLVDAIAWMRSTENKLCVNVLVVRLEASDQGRSSSVDNRTGTRCCVFFYTLSALSCPSCGRGIG